MVGTLCENEIHLWYQRLDLSVDPARFKSSTQTLVRQTLSQYAAILPQDWQFVKNPYGRPEISNPMQTSLRFNLSHCDGLAVCALSLDCELGVDIERVKDFEDVLKIAEENFSFAEFQTMKQLPYDLQIKRFYEYWTLKEAYLKARGLGLTFPLQNFSFLFDKGAIELSIGGKLDEKPNDWQFKILNPSKEHQLALAIRKNHPCECRIEEHWVPS